MKLTDEQITQAIQDAKAEGRGVLIPSILAEHLCKAIEGGITGDGRGEAKPVAFVDPDSLADLLADRCSGITCGVRSEHYRRTMPLYTAPPQQEQAAPVQDGPPFGTKRKAAMAIYKPPFKFYRGYIHDSAGHMVADQDGLDGEVEKSVVARVRGWGRIGYMPNPEELQDEVGQMMADALTAYYAAAPKEQEPVA